jgi:phosphatidylinositol-4,5-bisphosphate 3-kinase
MEKNSVLFLDPCLRTFFKYDLKTNQVSPAEKITSENKHRIDQEIEKLEILRGFEATHWSFETEEAQNYRRRAIWQYLLHPECSLTPNFISSKELGSAFAEVTEISLSIDVSDYLTQDYPSDIEDYEDFEENAGVCLKQAKKIIVVRSSLVSNVQETIKKLKEKLRDELNIFITPKENFNIFALKVLGRRDFLSEALPFIFYQSVRDCLRGLHVLQLKLSEIPKKTSENFPQFLSDDDQKVQVSSFLMFYSPGSEKNSPILTAPRVFALKSHKPLKERMEKTSQLLAGVTNGSKTFTGEIDWPFRVKVLGVEEFFKVFIDAFQGNALKNGTEQPGYLLDPCKKSVDKKHSKTSKKSTIEDRRQSIILIKSKSRAITKAASISQNISNYSNHHNSNSAANELTNKFNLPFAPYLLSFDLMLVYGDEIIEGCKIQSEYCPFTFNARLSNWINFPIHLSHLPKETRLGINVFAVSKTGETFLIASAVKSLFDEQGALRMGKVPLRLWPFYRVEHRLACMQEFWGVNQYEETPDINCNVKYLTNARLFVEFDSFSDVPVWSLKEETYLKSLFGCKSSKVLKISPRVHSGKSHSKFLNDLKSRLSSPESLKTDESDAKDLKLLKENPQIEDLANLEQILLKDPLDSLSSEDRRVLLICRKHYSSIPMALQLFLRAIDWVRPLQVREAHKMLLKWKKMSFEDMLSLLNPEYADEQVRLYCVQHISRISNEDFALYMPQLVQALCFETCHFSALGELLIERALQCPQIVGHSFFWALRGQLHVKATAERFGLVLEQFLMLCGNFRDQLLDEVKLVRYLQDLGNKLEKKDFEERQKVLKGLLNENDFFPGACTLPIDCGLESNGILASRCKVMNSKKMPLWMEMKSFGEGEIPVIFKVGDDLRQDILTLQMIKVMDTIWLDNGLDLRMRTYRVVVTGDQSGMIECVRNSMTTSDIQTKYGGKLGALKKNTILDYITECNPDTQQRNLALQNFVRSCAGYCVASYVLGIADRHNGNIMITNTGHLFHIDFGHFLGNFKTKFGIQRERSNFVLTLEMAHAMGGIDADLFKEFRNHCHSAYNLVRKHGRRLMNFFKLMISAGMPELQNKQEIEYIRDMLSLKLTDSEADDKFNEEIDTALNNTFRRVDNLIHNLRRN